MSLRTKATATIVCTAILLAPIPSFAQFDQLLGGGIGAAIGSRGGAGGAVAGAIIGVAMASILQQLSENERHSREVALRQAAKSGRASWSTHGKSGKRATYKKVGEVQSVGGQHCQKVSETITLKDGKQATSVENVCFAS
jgi:hypothetical protein